jgi:flagellar biosynthesis protein FliR
VRHALNHRIETVEMEEIQNILSSFLSNKIYVFLLIFARVMMIFLLIPAWGGKTIPGRFRVGISGIISLFLLNVLPLNFEMKFTSLRFAALLLKETLVGFLIGLLGSVVFYAIENSGQFVDVLRGQTIAQVLVPQMGVQSSQFGYFFLQLAIVIFFITDSHLIILQNLAESFRLLPPQNYWSIGGNAQKFIVEEFIKESSGLLALAVKIMTPVVITVFLVDIMMALINRISLSIQVFQLGILIKMWVAILLVTLIIRSLMLDLASLIPEKIESIFSFLKSSISLTL